jgi:DNA-binding GntR family transcriptional regulator
MEDRSVLATDASHDPLVALASRYAPLREPDPSRPRSLSNLAYERFMAALFERRLTPGASLSQNELVRILDVPVAPLRDALRVLQAEGLVTIHARSGIELAKPDFSMIRNTYQLRTILERAAIRNFAEVAPRDLLEDLAGCQQAVIDSVRGREVGVAGAQAVERIDFGLHMHVMACLQNPLIQATYRQAHSFDRLIRLDRAFRLSAPLVIRTMTEHLDMLAACLKRDPDAAEAALELHFARAMQRAMGCA